MTAAKRTYSERGPLRYAKVMKYEVNREGVSGGPKFSSLTEAAAYIVDCMKDGSYDAMTISRLKQE